MSSSSSEVTAIDKIREAVVSIMPEHQRVLDRNFASCSEAAKIQVVEIAKLVSKIVAGDVARLASGYEWMCRMIQEEELFFRRNGRYRCSSFSEALEQVYSVPSVMGPYMDGLLASQVLWSNHIQALEFYIDSFLGTAAPNARHLEIGPGHGLWLSLAAQSGRSVIAWDVSEESLAHTSECLGRMGIDTGVQLVRRDLLHEHAEFDDVVVSEVIEHLEDPIEAMRSLRRLVVPNGRAFINIPINSPVIDHISLFRTPEEVVNLVTNEGFRVESVLIAPASGYTEQAARRLEATMSCCIIARRVL